jgi:hypothetical protein
LAYISPAKRLFGNNLVDDPKKIAINYMKGYFLVDLFDVLPLPQVYFFQSHHAVVKSPQKPKVVRRKHINTFFVQAVRF